MSRPAEANVALLLPIDNTSACHFVESAGYVKLPVEDSSYIIFSKPSSNRRVFLLDYYPIAIEGKQHLIIETTDCEEGTSQIRIFDATSPESVWNELRPIIQGMDNPGRLKDSPLPLCVAFKFSSKEGKEQIGLEYLFMLLKGLTESSKVVLSNRERYMDAERFMESHKGLKELGVSMRAGLMLPAVVTIKYNRVKSSPSGIDLYVINADESNNTKYYMVDSPESGRAAVAGIVSQALETIGVNRP